MEELNNLAEVLAYWYGHYNKVLEEREVVMWSFQLRDYTHNMREVKKAFIQHNADIKIGHICPKPSLILRILKDNAGKAATAERLKLLPGESRYRQEYDEALEQFISPDKETSKKGWKRMQEIRPLLGRDELIRLNGSNYQFKPTSTFEGS